MNVRMLDATDAQAYQALRLLALRESPAAFSSSHAEEAGRSLQQVAARITPAADGSCVLGRFEQDQLAGSLALRHPQRAKLRHGVELAGMYVAASFRRRGIGGELLQAAIVHARSLAGVHRIALGVNDTNAAAKALYRSAGFVSYGVEPQALQIDGCFHDVEHYVLPLQPIRVALGDAQDFFRAR